MAFCIPPLRDPRILQIGFLSSFLIAGFVVFGFDLPWWEPPVLLATACACQWTLTRITGAPETGYRSPIISALGLSLLLRSDDPRLMVLASLAAIGSKFLVRVRGKHVFNPTNFGLAVAMLVSRHAWCSPSQWGENGATLGWLAILGLAVVHRAFRMEISLAFLGSWFLLKAMRVLYLGQKLPVLFHQISVGSLILFTLFMISDPKTTPNSRGGRILFAAGVAGLAFILQHQLWVQNPLIWSLLLLSPAVPLLDTFLKAQTYHWPTERNKPCSLVTTLSH